MSENLYFDGHKFDEYVESEDTINIPDDSDIGYFVDHELNYPDYIKERTKYFPFS